MPAFLDHVSKQDVTRQEINILQTIFMHEALFAGIDLSASELDFVAFVASVASEDRNQA